MIAHTIAIMSFGLLAGSVVSIIAADISREWHRIHRALRGKR